MNTRTPIILIIILFLTGISWTEANAQNLENAFSKANELYNQNAYDSAAVVYEDIINKGYSSAELYYNLGNTYYKMGNYPMSILYYEKSLKLDPNNEETKHNIGIAREFISDKIEPLPELFIKKWWDGLSNLFTLNTWSIITLIITACLLISLFFYMTAKSRMLKKSMFFTSILFILLTICTFSIATNKYNYMRSNNEGIIITPTITVKSSPSSSSVDLFVLHEGSKVKILDRTGEWEKIKIANGSVGWLPSSTIIKY